jgi:hypothetical protein
VLALLGTQQERGINMPEVQISDDLPFREGYMLNLQAVFLDLYRLLTIFGASKTLSQMADVHGGDAISELMVPEIDEITRIIVNASVSARIVDEREGFIVPKDKFCGVLISDLSKPAEVKGLDLREACNKIIHATKFRTVLEKENDKPYMLPTLYFYGNRGNIKWRATLDVYEFISTYQKIFRNA